jgi:hypothetical protein
MKILPNTRNAQKQKTIKWIPAHVGLDGNKIADILTKDGAINGTPIEYVRQLKDVYRILEETQRDDWNMEQPVRAEGSGEVGGPTSKLRRKSNPNTKLSSVDTRTVNRILTTHTYTPYWLTKMEIAKMRIQHFLYTCMKFTRRRLTCDFLD